MLLDSRFPLELSSPPPKPKRHFLPLSLSLDDLAERKKRSDVRASAKNEVLLPGTPISPPGFYDNLHATRIQSRRLANRRKSSRQLTSAHLGQVRSDHLARQRAFKKRNKKHLLLKVERQNSRDTLSDIQRESPENSPKHPSTESHYLSPGSPTKKHRLFGFKRGNVSPSRSIVSAKEIFASSPMRFFKNASNTVSRTFSSPKKKASSSTFDIANLDPAAKWYSPFKSSANLLVSAWKKKNFGSNSSLASAVPMTATVGLPKTKTSRSLSTPNACTPNEDKFLFLTPNDSSEDFCVSKSRLSLYEEIEQTSQQQLSKRMSIPDQKTLDEMDTPVRAFPPRKYSETYRPLMDYPRKCSTVLEMEPGILSTCVELTLSRSETSSEAFENPQKSCEDLSFPPESSKYVRKSVVFEESRAYFESRTAKSVTDLCFASAPVHVDPPKRPNFLAPNKKWSGRSRWPS
ncbi:hypothetical protein L596_024216 [Steinernema carpocapsae]|uniref:Uncharacterized protein n=1 Tax=Steinernema carpocapsae TaxID=34508 RepID=A0A4U5MG35_STECR|nr:hypothetical protein L596_024216 [Steinernema carpocapsae]